LLLEIQDNELEAEDKISTLHDKVESLEKEIHSRNALIQQLEETDVLGTDQDDDAWGLYILRLLLGNDDNSLYYYIAFLKFYFIVTISTVFRGNDFIPYGLESFLHFMFGIAGFITASKELIWEVTSDDNTVHSQPSSCVFPTFCFVLDLFIHILM
jgi:hypothetical protein